MTKTEKPMIALLDAFPGAGKTHLFRDLAFGLLTLGDVFDDDDSSFVCVYVAPTKILCETVYTTLCNQLRNFFADPDIFPDPEVYNRIHRVWSGTSEHHSSPVSQLNSLLGTGSSKKNRPVPTGHIIITTHESFSKVNNVPTAQPTWVFFDEARQCLGVRDSIRLPASVAPKILKPFRPVEVKPRDIDEETFRTSKERVYRLNVPESLEDLVVSGDEQSACNVAVAKLKDLIPTIRSGRSSVYILAPEAAITGPKTKFSSLKSIDIFPFQNPKRLFQNYARVTIMSAFFKSSQMYHALRHHYDIVDILRIDDKDPRVYPYWVHRCIELASTRRDGVISRDNRLRKNTSLRLKVVPLLVSNSDVGASSEDSALSVSSLETKKISSSDRLSKYMLTSGIITTVEAQASVIDYVQTNKLSMNSNSVITTVWLHWYFLKSSAEIKKSIVKYWEEEYKASYHSHVPELYGLLKPFIIDQKTGLPVFPAWTLTRQAHSLSKSINRNEKPLLVYNAPSDGMPYTPIPNAILKKVGLPVKSSPVKNTQEFLRERFNKSFEIPESPKLNGLNNWTHCQHFVHLAALNPNPKDVLLLSYVLPKYDAVYDYLLENLVQTLYRTSLRAPYASIDLPVYLFISKSSTALLLAKKLRLSFNFFDLETIDHHDLVDLNFTTAEFKLKHRRRQSKAKQKYADKTLAVSIQRTQAGIRRYALLEKSGAALTEKQSSKLKSLRAELKKLQSEAGV